MHKRDQPGAAGKATPGGTELDMINRVQMYQIACDKVNTSLKQQRKKPLFELEVSQSNEDETNLG